MLSFPAAIQVFLCTQPCDMRRSFDGLSMMAEHIIRCNPFSGHLFVFCNRRSDRVKILYWDRDGWAIWYNRPREEFLPAQGRIGHNLLLDPGADIDVITMLKDYGKALPQCLKSDARRSVATVIYYASIAIALVHHGRRITRLSYETLQNGYKELMEKPWVPAELKSLFEKASGVCRKRMTKPQ